ncbi:MAG TPA: hypothetical protein VM841_05420 [Actinomycetota bacterium]|nr:hypothetical protein [Actinomycetota bacterium]
MTDSAGLTVTLLITGAILAFGASYAVNAAMPPRLRRDRTAHAPKARPKPEPAPLTGGATGLLESIPFLESAEKDKRLHGAGRLVVGIVAAAAVLALSLFLFASRLTAWLDAVGF